MSFPADPSQISSKWTTQAPIPKKRTALTFEASKDLKHSLPDRLNPDLANALGEDLDLEKQIAEEFKQEKLADLEEEIIETPHMSGWGEWAGESI